MSVLEPIIGHLLSRYKQTCLEGLDKIAKLCQADATFAATFVACEQAVSTLLDLPARNAPDYMEPTLTTCLVLLQSCTSTGTRFGFVRQLARGKFMSRLRACLSVVSDATVGAVVAALNLLSAIAEASPKLLLSRFNNEVPLQLACFRAQLPYSQRRLRSARVPLLLSLALSRYAHTTVQVICSHGYLTQLLEDAAVLLQEGTASSLAIAKQVIHLVETHFVVSRHITKDKKRDVLMGQRNILRLLVKALEVDEIAEEISSLIRKLAAEFVESPSNYSTVRLDSSDRGMPNYILFAILRQMRPKNSEVVAQLLVFILNLAPDLIRPYFSRVSSHLLEEGNTRGGLSRAIVVAATVNVMTRVFLAPLPYHLAAGKATLEPSSSSSTTFFALSPQNVVDEICPHWIGEFVHRMVNSSTNLMTLVWALQVTGAALTRAIAVLAAVRQIQAKQGALRQGHSTACDAAPDAHRADGREADGADEEAASWHAFDANVLAALASTMPRREEFWHRVTQQLHPELLRLQSMAAKASEAGGAGAGRVPLSDKDTKALAKHHFVMQRVLATMAQYTDVFQLRVSWISAVPTFLPTFAAPARAITEALRRNNDILAQWSPQSVSLLGALLTSNLRRGVPVTRLHHITVSNPKGGITDWPILLSLLLWFRRRMRGLVAPTATPPDRPTLEALGWITNVVLWTVHSVTVCFACEPQEVFLWISTLTEETIPLFVHLINSMLQRGLSKAADRVAQDALSGPSGALALSARQFLTKHEERQQVAAGAAVEAGETRTARQAPHRAGSKATTYDFWVNDMAENAAAFAHTIDVVEAQWVGRDERYAAFFAPLIAEDPVVPASINARRQLLSQAVLRVVEQNQSVVPLHDLYLTFCRSLVSPMPPKEEEVYLHDAILSKRLAPGQVNTTALGDVVQLLLPRTLDRFAVEWLSSSCLCWSVCGTFMQSMRVDSVVAGKAAESFARRLFRHLHSHREALAAWLRLAPAAEGAAAGPPELEVAGFLTLLLFASHVLLLRTVQMRSGGGVTKKQPRLETEEVCPVLVEDEVLETVGQVLVRSYAGTVDVCDRLRYGVLLNIHHLLAPASPETAAPDADTNFVDRDNKDDDDEDDDYDDDGDDVPDGRGGAEGDIESDTQPRGDTGDSHARDRNAVGDAGPSKRGRPQHASARRGAGGTGGGVWLRDCEVVSVLVSSRFAIMDSFAAPHVTAEVDVLAAIVDTWTEEEVNAMALQCPSRLNNHVFVPLPGRQGRAPHESVDWSYTMQRSVFPDCSTPADAALMSLDELTSSSVLDPRYLLPLLHTVGSIMAARPHLAPRYLLTKSFAYLIRALSFSDAQLRAHAANTLALLRGLTPQRRLLLNFVRLKMLHLAASSRRVGDRDAVAAHPMEAHRLPAAFSSFVVLAQGPLHSLDHRLHNHVVNYLINPWQYGFATSVPMRNLIAGFPLACVTTPLMVKRQEELQRHGRDRSGIAQVSAAEVQAQLEQESPEHLHFILQLLRYGCQTAGDAAAILGCSRPGATEPDCLAELLLLATMLSSSVELRLTILSTVQRILTNSTDVAMTFLGRNNGHRGRGLGLLLGLARQLCLEYGSFDCALPVDGLVAFRVAMHANATYQFGGSVFMLVLQILTALAPVAARIATYEELLQVFQQVQNLSMLLASSGVTAKATLEKVDELIHLCGAALATRDRRAQPTVRRRHVGHVLR